MSQTILNVASICEATMSEPFDTVIAAYSAGYERGQQDELARIQEWLRSERSILS